MIFIDFGVSEGPWGLKSRKHSRKEAQRDQKLGQEGKKAWKKGKKGAQRRPKNSRGTPKKGIIQFGNATRHANSEPRASPKD